MSEDISKQAAKLVAAIPTDSQGDGRKFADAVRKSLNYIAMYIGTGGGGSGSGGSSSTIDNQLGNFTMTYEKDGDYYNLILEWDKGTFGATIQYSYALASLQQGPYKGVESVDWSTVGSRIYQSAKGDSAGTDGKYRMVIKNVLSGYAYKATLIGVTNDGARSDETKAPTASVFIPLDVRATTPLAFLNTTATASGLLIEWGQPDPNFYTYTEIRDNDSNFGTDVGLIVRSRGNSYLYIPTQRTGIIYGANYGISKKYSDIMSSQYSFPELSTPEKPTYDIVASDDGRKYCITLHFKQPSYGLGTNVYVNGVKYQVNSSKNIFTFYTTRSTCEVYLTYYDIISESDSSASISIDIDNPDLSDTTTHINIHSNDVTTKTLTSNDATVHNISSNDIDVVNLRIQGNVQSTNINAENIVSDSMTSKAGNISALAADSINSTNISTGVADINAAMINDLTATHVEVYGNLSSKGYVTATKVFNAVYNDYAEWFERGDDAERGDIVALDEDSDYEQYVKAKAGDKVVVGIVSSDYAHIIGGLPSDNYEADNMVHFVPVCLMGRVPVKVKGPVHVGQYIIPSSDAGIGIAVWGRTRWSVGMALESNDNNDVKLVKVLVRE